MRALYLTDGVVTAAPQRYQSMEEFAPLWWTEATRPKTAGTPKYSQREHFASKQLQEAHRMRAHTRHGSRVCLAKTASQERIPQKRGRVTGPVCNLSRVAQLASPSRHRLRPCQQKSYSEEFARFQFRSTHGRQIGPISSDPALDAARKHQGARRASYGEQVSKAHGDTRLLELDSICRTVVSKCKEIVGAQRCALFIVDGEELVFRVAEDSPTIRLPKDKGIVGSVTLSGEGLNIPDAYMDSRFNRAVDKATGFATRSVLCLPVLCAKTNKVIAVTQLLNKLDERQRGVSKSASPGVFRRSLPGKQPSAGGRSFFANGEYVRAFLPTDEDLLRDCCAQVSKALTPLLESRGRMDLSGALNTGGAPKRAKTPTSTANAPKVTRRQRRMSGSGINGLSLIAFQQNNLQLPTEARTGGSGGNALPPAPAPKASAADEDNRTRSRSA